MSVSCRCWRKEQTYQRQVRLPGLEEMIRVRPCWDRNQMPFRGRSGKGENRIFDSVVSLWSPILTETCSESYGLIKGYRSHLSNGLALHDGDRGFVTVQRVVHPPQCRFERPVPSWMRGDLSREIFLLCISATNGTQQVVSD